MRRLNPTTIALIAGVLLVLILVIAFARGGGGKEDRVSDNQLAQARESEPEERCASKDSYDLIKRELFRRAAEVRGSDQAAFDRLSAYSVVRMERPVLRSEDEEMGTITCAGSLSLDLPPGVAVVGGRRTLSADIGYTLQTAADGSGDVITLTNADPIVTPLATLARVGQPRSAPLAPPPLAPLPGDPVAPPDDAAPPPPLAPQPPGPPVEEPQAQPTASPSFNCRFARTRGEIAVCNDRGLASLDRQMASQFNSALARANPEQRTLLLRTRSRFLAFRDRCGSNACIADAYRGRMREIGDILAGRWSPPR